MNSTLLITCKVHRFPAKVADANPLLVHSGEIRPPLVHPGVFFYDKAMLTWIDHLILWGAFFGLGLAIGFLGAWALVKAGGGKRL